MSIAELPKNPRDIILKPVVSEKTYSMSEDGKYVFLVAPRANKTEIRISIEKIFGVTVTSVHTVNRAGKRKRTRTGYGKRPNTKRAIVTLAEGEEIPLLESPAT